MPANGSTAAAAAVGANALVPVAPDGPADLPELAKVPKSCGATEGSAVGGANPAGAPFVILFMRNYRYVPVSAVRSMCKYTNETTMSPVELGALIPAKAPKKWKPYLSAETLVFLVGGESGNGCVYTTFAVPGGEEQRLLRVVCDRVAEKIFPEVANEFDKTDLPMDSNSRRRALKRRAVLEWRKNHALNFKVHLVIRNNRCFTRDWEYLPGPNHERVTREYVAQDGDVVEEYDIPGCRRPQIQPEIEHWPEVDAMTDNIKTVAVASKPNPRTKKGGPAGAAGRSNAGDDEEEDDDDDDDDDGHPPVDGAAARARAGGSNGPGSSATPRSLAAGTAGVGKRMAKHLAHESVLKVAHGGKLHVQKVGPRTYRFSQFHFEDPTQAPQPISKRATGRRDADGETEADGDTAATGADMDEDDEE